MNTTTKLHTCKHCGEKFTVVNGEIKRARDVHEARHCSEYWEQQDELEERFEEWCELRGLTGQEVGSWEQFERELAC